MPFHLYLFHIKNENLGSTGLNGCRTLSVSSYLTAAPTTLSKQISFSFYKSLYLQSHHAWIPVT